MPLIIGNRTRYANHVPAVSVASRFFPTPVQKADVDSDGIQYGGLPPWRMNGGSVVLRGRKTPVNLPARDVRTGWIDDVPVRTVTFESSPQYEQTYRLGERIRVHVRFAEAVTVRARRRSG